LLKEAGLAEGGLVNPNTIAKLGNMKGIDAIVSGSLTSQGNNMRIFVKVLELETASVLAAVGGDISMNPDIQAMSGNSVSTSSPKPRKSSGSSSSKPKRKADGDKSHIIEKDGIEYSFLQCVRKKDKITVTILASNVGEEDNAVQVYYPGNGRLYNNDLRIFDTKNTQISGDPNSITIAGQQEIVGRDYGKGHKSSFRHVQQTILSGSSAEIEVTFVVNENFGEVLAIEFLFGSGFDVSKNFAHRFKNIEETYE